MTLIIKQIMKQLTCPSPELQDSCICWGVSFAPGVGWWMPAGFNMAGMDDGTSDTSFCVQPGKSTKTHRRNIPCTNYHLCTIYLVQRRNKKKIRLSYRIYPNITILPVVWSHFFDITLSVSSWGTSPGMTGNFWSSPGWYYYSSVDCYVC